MENKKLLKFLYKDIEEIEEMLTEKGSEGFDQDEIDFIQTRFSGAKQIIQILSEKENKFLKKTGQWAKERKELDAEIPASPAAYEAAYAKEEPSDKAPVVSKKEPTKEHTQQQKTEATASTKKTGTDTVSSSQKETNRKETEFKMEEETEPITEKQCLGESFLHEKSVNEVLSNETNNNLENKLSNSPVNNIKENIGINDRYLYIRELFNGNADAFSTAVTELDKLHNIQEAVDYLQQNYKWKKNETSLKFINLVKRRFANV